MALLYPVESYAIRGAIFEVHKQKGTGFLEKVYQECLEREFIQRGIPYEREKRIKIDYKGVELQQEYIADFVCYDKIIVECKAVKELIDVYRAQSWLTSPSILLRQSVSLISIGSPIYST